MEKIRFLSLFYYLINTVNIKLLSLHFLALGFGCLIFSSLSAVWLMVLTDLNFSNLMSTLLATLCDMDLLKLGVTSPLRFIDYSMTTLSELYTLTQVKNDT